MRPRLAGNTLLLCCVALFVCCGARSGLLYPREDGRNLDVSQRLDGQPDRPSLLPDLRLPAPGDFVYAHSSDILYKLDPATLALLTVGSFGWPAGGDSMTDLALSRTGLLIGLSYHRVYAVNPKTAACILLSSLPGSFNALAFLPAPGGSEDLVAVSAGGDVFRLDPTTGKAVPMGSYGGGYGSSGDLVWTDAGIVATVTASMVAGDLLVKLEAATGKATPIGPIGATAVWGLAYQKGQLVGFTDGGKVLVLDKKTGAGKVVGSVGAKFWGAASPPPPGY